MAGERVMRVVCAPDSFKGSLSALAAAEALREGWLSERPGDDVVLRPMADGGEGTLAAFEAAYPAARREPVEVIGPDDRPHLTHWLRLPDGTGVVELAATSGIELLGSQLRPLEASTLGFGQAVATALDAGVERLVLGIGSSASTDGGLGLLTALGGRFCMAAGAPAALGAGGLAAVAKVDLSDLRSLPAGGVTVFTDVTSPLVGEHGAARVFGPQKGLSPDEAIRVDHELARVADLLGYEVDAPGAGAAGGVGAALLRWGATLVPGAVAVAELLGLPALLRGASLAITGEGSYDAQSAVAKVPATVAELAAQAGVAVALVAGRIAPDADTSAFWTQLSLTELAASAEASMARPADYLRQAGALLAVEATSLSPR